MADYTVNKGIGKTVEFKGLKSQYLFILVGGLLCTFFMYVILYAAGLNQWFCICFCGSIAALTLWLTFYLNAKYGEYGIMKWMATKRRPYYILNRRRISRLFINTK